MTEINRPELNHWERLGYTAVETENITIVHKHLKWRDANGYENAKAELRAELHELGVDVDKEVSFYTTAGFSEKSTTLSLVDGRGDIYALWTKNLDAITPSTEFPKFIFARTAQSDDGTIMSISRIDTALWESRKKFLTRLAGMAQKGLAYMGKGTRLAMTGSRGISLEFTRPLE